MILPSTLRKLAAQDQLVYRVDTPAFRATISADVGGDIPAGSQHFATMSAAGDFARKHDCTAIGATSKPAIHQVLARSLDPLTTW